MTALTCLTIILIKTCLSDQYFHTIVLVRVTLHFLKVSLTTTSYRNIALRRKFAEEDISA